MSGARLDWRHILLNPSKAWRKLLKKHPHQHDAVWEWARKCLTPTALLWAKDEFGSDGAAVRLSYLFTLSYYGICVGPSQPPPPGLPPKVTIRLPSELTITLDREDLAKKGLPSMREVRETREAVLFAFDKLLHVFKRHEELRRELGIEWLSLMFRSQPTCWYSDIFRSRSPALATPEQAVALTKEDWINRIQPDHKKWAVYTQIIEAAKLRQIQVPLPEGVEDVRQLLEF